MRVKRRLDKSFKSFLKSDKRQAKCKKTVRYAKDYLRELTEEIEADKQISSLQVTEYTSSHPTMTLVLDTQNSGRIVISCLGCFFFCGPFAIDNPKLKVKNKGGLVRLKEIRTGFVVDCYSMNFQKVERKYWVE